MKDVEKIILKIKITQEVTININPEEGYDAFPDNVLDMVSYINEVRSEAERGHYIESVHRAESFEEYELVEIQVIEKD